MKKSRVKSTSRRGRKRVTRNLPPASAGVMSHQPGTLVPDATGSVDKLPEGISSQDEYEYKMLLQEAIIWASTQFLEEHRKEILLLAEARVRTLRELRG